MPNETTIAIKLRDNQACIVTLPPSSEPTTIEISSAKMEGRFQPEVSGPIGMKINYRNAVKSLTKRQRPS